MFDITTHDVSQKVIAEHFGIGSQYFKMLLGSVGMSLFIIIVGLLLLLLSLRVKEIMSVAIMCIVVGFILTIAVSVFSVKDFIDKNSNEELEVKSQNIKIESTIDNITNGSDKDEKELRLSSNKHNYYITIEDDVPVKVGDTIKIKGNNILTTKQNRNARDLSDNLDAKPLDVTITHKGNNIKATPIMY